MPDIKNTIDPGKIWCKRFSSKTTVWKLTKCNLCEGRGLLRSINVEIWNAVNDSLMT